MPNHKIKLELTWIGKENRPNLEPRILIEAPEKSYHAAHRVSESDLFDNRLIFGDNLLALKALEQEFTGKIKCIYVDPPFNTGQAFDHYEDGIEHSLWLSLMRDRIALLWKLLSPDGTLWVHLDDNEVHYLKVLMDEIFGRQCFVASVAWRAADSSNNDAKQFSIDHNTILVYSREPGWLSRALPRTDEANAHYKNPDNDPRGPWFMGNVSSPHPREKLQYDMTTPSGTSIPHPHNGWRWSRELAMKKIEAGQIIFVDDDTRIVHKTYLADQKGLAPSSMWHDIKQTGHNRQAKYELKKLFPGTPTTELFSTPKPERLIERVLRIATDEGDWVLDSFAGSGTTGAVAHKLGRRWVMVELGEHCHEVIVPRLHKVIDGRDKGGITDAVEWKGGGGFRYYKLGPTLIVEDEWGNPVINKAFNPGMLAEAMCKLEGFEYAPSEDTYWMHGHSSEQDFIYVTTQTLTRSQLQRLSDEVGEKRSLLVMCAAFRVRKVEDLPNLTVKKIPKAVLKKCEWGHDDYSLEIANLPEAPAMSESEEEPKPVKGKRKFGKGRASEASLFAGAATDDAGGA
jgi:adenine-specific DNA-methyltransferase